MRGEAGWEELGVGCLVGKVDGVVVGRVAAWMVMVGLGWVGAWGAGG